MSFVVSATDLPQPLGRAVFLDHALCASEILSLDSMLMFVTRRNFSELECSWMDNCDISPLISLLSTHFPSARSCPFVQAHQKVLPDGL